MAGFRVEARRWMGLSRAISHSFEVIRRDLEKGS